MAVAPTEGTALERPEVASGCNECNEALDKARTAIADARRLALIAQNALIRDVRRAHAALRDLHDATSNGATLEAAFVQPAVRLLLLLQEAARGGFDPRRLIASTRPLTSASCCFRSSTAVFWAASTRARASGFGGGSRRAQ